MFSDTFLEDRRERERNGIEEKEESSGHVPMNSGIMSKVSSIKNFRRHKPKHFSFALRFLALPPSRGPQMGAGLFKEKDENFVSHINMG